MFSLDRDSPAPLADQIETRLRALVEGGRLSAGAKLPSIRTCLLYTSDAADE